MNRTDEDLKMAAALDWAKRAIVQLPPAALAVGPLALMLCFDGRFVVWRVSDLITELREQTQNAGGGSPLNEVEVLAPKIVDGTMMVLVEYDVDVWLVARALLDGAVVNANGGSA